MAAHPNSDISNPHTPSTKPAPTTALKALHTVGARRDTNPYTSLQIKFPVRALVCYSHHRIW